MRHRPLGRRGAGAWLHTVGGMQVRLKLSRCKFLMGPPAQRCAGGPVRNLERRHTAGNGERALPANKKILSFPHTNATGRGELSCITILAFPPPHTTSRALMRTLLCAGPAMPSFWSFFRFVGSLHLSSARVRTSGRDLLLPFAVHLASVACRKSALLVEVGSFDHLHPVSDTERLWPQRVPPKVRLEGEA